MSIALIVWFTLFGGLSIFLFKPVVKILAKPAIYTDEGDTILFIIWMVSVFTVGFSVGACVN